MILKSSISQRMKVENFRGFSLVELLVALVVGLLITLGAFQLFVTSKRTFDHSLAVMERQETLRFLIDSLIYDARSAVYTDLLDDGDVLSDQATLSMTFNKENAVCDDNEYTMRYYQPTGNDDVDPNAIDRAVYVEAICGGVTVDEPIVLGIATISFTYIDFGFGVKVKITMEDEFDRLPVETYNFTIANRSAVGRALELWGE